MSAPQVYTAMCAVMEDIGKTGISKDRRNQQQGYNFRGIDDVYNELNGLLSKHRLVMLPTVVETKRTERETKNGGVLFYTQLTIDFKLVSAEDGSSDVIRTVGEAMDSGDKSSNKAQSAAYKYAAMMVFCIPTEGDNDADATTHEVKATNAASGPSRAAQQAPREEPKPPTLSQRADRLEATLKGVKTQADLRKAYDLASGLCADLDAKDPERLSEVNALYERRFAELAEREAA